MEQWKQIPLYDKKYEISNIGIVVNTKTGRTLKQHKESCGYYQVVLTNGKKRKWVMVHRMVAELFVPNPKKEKEVNHIDGNKENNVYTNLEWVSHKENMKHAKHMCLTKPTKLVLYYNKEKVLECFTFEEARKKAKGKYPKPDYDVLGYSKHKNRKNKGYKWVVIKSPRKKITREYV